MDFPGFGKPGGAYAPIPVNHLSGKAGRPKGRQPASSSPDLQPAAKKQKLHEDQSLRFRNSRKAAVEGIDDFSDAASDQRSTTDQGGSQGAISRKESNLHSAGSIEEFRHAEDTPRRKRRGQTTKQMRTRDLEQGLSRSDSGVDELGETPETPNNGYYTPRAQSFRGGGHSRSSLGDGADDQFQRNQERQSRFRSERKTARIAPPGGVDHSPDPLHSDPFHMDTKEEKQAKKRPSSSLSSRGDIHRTWPKSRSAELDTPGFRVKAAVCQPHFKLWPSKEGEDEALCTLIPSEDRTRLAAVPVENSDETELFWLDIACDKLQRVERSSGSSFVKLVRSANPGLGLGAQLMLECLDNQAAESLVGWLKRNSKVKPDVIDDNKLRQLWGTFVSIVDNAIGKRDTRKADGELLSEPSVVAQPLRVRAEQDGVPPSKALRGTTRDTMQTYSARDRRNGAAGVSPYFGRSLRNGPRSPTPVSNPPPPRWSEQQENEHWDKDWDMPLVFKRTTVDKADIPKLDEGECLNDNLISFGLRYFFDHFESRHDGLDKRAFFLNSFFYEKLKMPGKGKINYDGVKNWTSKVDILSYDYIIVPVNEFHHWWVAIICNPGRLAPDTPGPSSTSKDRDADVTANQPPNTTETAQISAPTTSEVLDVEMTDVNMLQPPRSPEGATAAGMSSLSIDSPDEPEAHKPQTASQLKDQKAVIDLSSESVAVDGSPDAKQGPKKRGKGGKYDPKNTRIITLDSLGSAHSAACTHLKKYLVAEFKDKRGIDITDLPPTMGMTATNIPQQDNFCDCGVYLLGYIREFVRDPDAFISLLLEKRDCNWSWTASELRAELRGHILDFQKEYQEEQIKAKKKRAAQKRAKASGEAPTTPSISGPSIASTGMNSAPSTARSSVAPSAVPSAVASRNQSPSKDASTPVVTKLALPVPAPICLVVDEEQQSTMPSTGGHALGRETLQTSSSDLRPLKRAYEDEKLSQVGPPASSPPAIFGLGSNDIGLSRNDHDGQLQLPMPSPKRLRPDPAGHRKLDDDTVPAGASHHGSPIQAASREETLTPTPVIKVASPTSRSEASEVDKQLRGEALQAVEKATVDQPSQSSLSDTFKDPPFLTELPNSSPCRRASSPLVPPTAATRRSPQVNKISVDIPRASSKSLRTKEFIRYPDGDEDNALVVGDSQETKRMVQSKDDDVVEISRQKRLMRSGALAPNGKSHSAWSSGSQKVTPVRGARVLAPLARDQKHPRSPASPTSKAPVSRRAPQPTNSGPSIDLTGED